MFIKFHVKDNVCIVNKYLMAYEEEIFKEQSSEHIIKLYQDGKIKTEQKSININVDTITSVEQHESNNEIKLIIYTNEIKQNNLTELDKNIICYYYVVYVIILRGPKKESMLSNFEFHLGTKHII